MPTIQELATELGIDPGILAGKPDVVTKWNNHFTDADTKLAQAKENLQKAENDQRVINDQIQKFGITEQTNAQLRAANAALDAALKEVKKSGFDINIPDLPVNPAPQPMSAEDRIVALGNQMGKALRVQTRFAQVFGKPFSDDLTGLYDEAKARHMDVEAWAEQKYGFAAESKRRADEDAAKHDADIAAKAVAKYREENPILPGHERRGMASQHPQVMKPKTVADTKSFMGMSPRQKLEASVARGRALAATLNQE